MITIVDYGMGNLDSVAKAALKFGADIKVTDSALIIKKSSKIILPGVGNFGQAVTELKKRKLYHLLIEKIKQGIPFVGICVGMQLLFEASQEAPGVKGLAAIPGEVKKFRLKNLVVPHMGWNQLERRRESRLLAGLGERPFVYFAHSYYVPDSALAAAICTYQLPYTAVLESGNVFGVQFHPEKSGAMGLQIVKNYVEL